MKAIDIIKGMVYDSNLSECATLHPYCYEAGVNEWIEAMFGDFRVKTGEPRYGATYLAVFAVDENKIYPFQCNFKPEVVLERNNPEEYPIDDREVWLWEVEE